MIIDIYFCIQIFVFFGVSKLYNTCVIYFKLSPISEVKCIYCGPTKSKSILFKGQLQLLLLLFGGAGDVCVLEPHRNQSTALSLSCIPSPEPWS